MREAITIKYGFGEDRKILIVDEYYEVYPEDHEVYDYIINRETYEKNFDDLDLPVFVPG